MGRGRASSRSRVFFVESGPARSLLSIVEQLGGTSDALVAGRVFVDGRRRSDPALRLEPGQRVELREARVAPPVLTVVGRSLGLIAVEKPAGISTEPDRQGRASLVAAAALELGVPLENVHACSRLDLGVSGIVLLALDREARRRVAEARQRGELRRRYVALAAHAPARERGSWHLPIDGRAAETRYLVVEPPARSGAPALLALEPVTGRTHQLRVHASAAGAALLGDRAHGGPTRLVLPSGAVRPLSRVCLHAAWVRLPNPGGGCCEFRAPIPSDLSQLFGELGGEPSAWARALDDSILATG
jgi:23S rRNA-/tRNA-specific pseudouridylate synthase